MSWASPTPPRPGCCPGARERIADLCAAEEDLSFEEATERLGYTAAVRKAAITYARTALRGRRLRLYVRSVVDALVAEGLASQQGVVIVPVADDVLAAAVVLAFDAPASALVWDERWGWRTPRAAAPDGSGDRAAPPRTMGSATWARISSPRPRRWSPLCTTTGAEPADDRPRRGEG
ncbi:hypothetical protein OG698_01520 [Streptomyces sp. NBC_01003]|uniref:hypothetical protein n=1 Tax=Streptomyces sp. NBC_01003 TaxID=2903714 RepID=UPI0038691200|nr:hypothetical protein OG698_01520 [Streptomyces sp. NBC_01003]